MGRSNPCFRIITCGSDSSAEKDDIDIQGATENKGSSDKRGWSFRKRSARDHRVLSNIVTSEAPSAANKETIESASLAYQQQVPPSAPEKISVVECIEEKPPLSVSVDEKASKTATDKDEWEVDTHVEESVIIFLQSAVRAFMAKKELVKLKNVVKLQAAVRGHLVRQHAAGTLRCVQAMVKMQILVRARQARARGLNVVTGKDETKASAKTSKKDLSVAKPAVTYTSLEKLLSNKFARQLMESTPKSRAINIKCDPLQPNSGWSWLERWMSASSVAPTPKPESFPEKVEEEEEEEKEKKEYAAPVESESSHVEDLISNIKESVSSPEREENLITYDASDSVFQACRSTLSVVDDLELPEGDVNIPSDGKEASTNSSHLPVPVLQSGAHFQPAQECEEPEPLKRCMKRRLPSEESENEGNKFVYGSRKVSNPAFAAAQSKFEELSSATDSNKTANQALQDGRLDEPLTEESLTITKEPSMTENLVSHVSNVQNGDSECGTELSVTSTLDSPDISVVGAPEPDKKEAKTSEEETSRLAKLKSGGESFKDALEDTLPGPPNPATPTQTEELYNVKDEEAIVNSIPSVTETGVAVADRLSPQGSPVRSHMTVPESQGTPASQASVTRSERPERRRASSHKRKSVSAGKMSAAASPQTDSSNVRSSAEHSASKDLKNGKRRNSFGSPRRGDEPTEQEARASNGSDGSLPRFMQATESARAKLLAANSSPRSSPDVSDREHLKKRHSLPGANGRQVSPRIQRTSSQTQSASKPNASSLVPQEKKWQR